VLFPRKKKRSGVCGTIFELGGRAHQDIGEELEDLVLGKVVLDGVVDKEEGQAGEPEGDGVWVRLGDVLEEPDDLRGRERGRFRSQAKSLEDNNKKIIIDGEEIFAPGRKAKPFRSSTSSRPSGPQSQTGS
jgi:hypothetical protein